MNPGPITSQCFPPDHSSEFRVVTVDFRTKREIEPVYQGASDSKANKAFIETVKHIERAREEEGHSFEPVIVQLWENGEKLEELDIA